MVGALPVHGRHTGKSSSTRQALTRARWGADLGFVLAEFGLGPKMKIEAHTKLYVFYLESQVIRVTN
jgi:hypothetical protein